MDLRCPWYETKSDSHGLDSDTCIATLVGTALQLLISWLAPFPGSAGSPFGGVALVALALSLGFHTRDTTNHTAKQAKQKNMH